MTERHRPHFDIRAARAAYAEGRNVTELLRAQQHTDSNTPEIIELAYDLQAGTYIAHADADPARALAYAAELAAILDRHIQPTDVLLDIGTGELTTLSPMVSALVNKPAAVVAFDISWSRLFKGRAYAREKMAADFERLTTFVGDIGEIPLPDKSVDITTSSHALEPNGGRLKELLSELFRVTAGQLVLFEPCYEVNSEAGRQRMDRLGYIRNMEGIAAELGATVVDRIAIRNVSNPLNPTVGFVITPPAVAERPARRHGASTITYSMPGTNLPLRRVDDFYLCDDTGLCFPVLKGLPVLRSNAAILASALCA